MIFGSADQCLIIMQRLIIETKNVLSTQYQDTSGYLARRLGHKKDHCYKTTLGNRENNNCYERTTNTKKCEWEWTTMYTQM